MLCEHPGREKKMESFREYIELQKALLDTKSTDHLIPGCAAQAY